MISNQQVQAFLIYISGGWIVLEITDYIISNYGLTSRARDVLSIILLAGLPVVVFLSWYLGKEKEDPKKGKDEHAREGKKPGIINRIWKRRWFFLPGLLVMLLLLLTAIRTLHNQAKIHWALEEAVPEIHNLLNDWEYAEAFRIREQVKKYIQGSPEFMNLDSMLTMQLAVLTDPDGVEVYFKEYKEVEGEWNYLGTTPVVNREMPIRTLYRWKFVKPGYEDVYAVFNTFQDTLFRTMFKSGSIPAGMSYVEGIGEETTGNFLSGNKHGFFIDKFEVSNRQYKDFLDQGGYQNSDFWKEPFVLKGDTLSFEEAITLFSDATGRPGPAPWVAGDFPDGEEDYPVNGISWYEAAAYAKFAGKSLPSLDHWRTAAGSDFYFYFQYAMGSLIVPVSNFEGQGRWPVGSGTDLNCFGLYDKKELNEIIEERDESPEDWIMETVSFDAAYEGERVLAILFLPESARPPFQTIVYFPGSGALEYNASIFEYGTTRRNLFYLLKNGRAVLFPIYYGTFNRKHAECNVETPLMTHQFTECTVKWVKDFSRSMDYLETREDIDFSRIAFLGDSWGGRLGAIIPAVEGRLKLNIMLRGGFRKTKSFPEVDELNYVTRVKIPTLMLNGRYDISFPYESSSKLMFDLLGTPDEDKKQVLCDTDHFIPTSVMVKEVLDWLDTYFGPVIR